VALTVFLLALSGTYASEIQCSKEGGSEETCSQDSAMLLQSQVSVQKDGIDSAHNKFGLQEHGSLSGSLQSATLTTELDNLRASLDIELNNVKATVEAKMQNIFDAEEAYVTLEGAKADTTATDEVRKNMRSALQNLFQRARKSKHFLKSKRVLKSNRVQKSERSASDHLFQRVWMLCKELPSEASLADEIAAHMAPVDIATCSAEASYQDICCTRWSNASFINTGFLQLPPTNSTTNQEVLKLCTQDSNGTGILLQSGSAGASLPVDCITQDITWEQLLGNSTLEPGEIVLRHRLLWFAISGIPIQDVPRCDQTVSSCPDGKPPVNVNPAWLQEQTALQQASLIQLDGQVGKHAGVKVTVSAGNMFHGALLTSGSFTMRASSAF
jgi:hypothetical protein